jgi:hypothetical protein
MTITEIGALVGFATGIFTVIDRFVLGRPYVTIVKDAHYRYLKCLNTSEHDIIVTGLRTSTKALGVAHSHDVKAITEAAAGVPFTAILSKKDDAYFPIIVKDGALLDESSRSLSPFVIMVSWRKTRSLWLPQIPAFIFSSMRGLRRLQAARKVGDPL